MITPGEALAGIAAPALAGAVLGLATRWLPGPTRAGWAGAGVLAAAIIGHAALSAMRGDPLLPPRNGYQWALALPVLALPALVLPLGGWARAGWMALAGAGFGLLAGWPLHPHALAGTALAVLAGVAALATAGTGAAQEVRSGGAWWRLGVLAALGATAIQAALAGSLVLGQLAGTAAAAWGGLVLARWRGPAAPGLGWAAAALLTAHLGVNAVWLYSDLRGPAIALTALAVPAAWLLPLPGSGRRDGLRLVLALVLIAGALAWTALLGQPATSGGSGGDLPY